VPLPDHRSSAGQEPERTRPRPSDFGRVRSRNAAILAQIARIARNRARPIARTALPSARIGKYPYVAGAHSKANRFVLRCLGTVKNRDSRARHSPNRGFPIGLLCVLLSPGPARDALKSC